MAINLLRTKPHGSVALSQLEHQENNRSWWNATPMTYEFSGSMKAEPLSPGWFDAMDERFVRATRLFNDAPNPIVELMGDVAGKRVLEIGCGMGYHSELLARAGAELTSIDLTPRAVEVTSHRLRMKGLPVNVHEMDAEALDLPDRRFDMVWSWGVIHHSSRTSHCVREIARVLKPGGAFKAMVYNLEGTHAYQTIMRRYAFNFWRGASLEEALWKDMDGFTARYYSRDSWRDLLSLWFDDIDFKVCGSEADVVPLPRRFRAPFLRMMSEEAKRRAAAKRGTYLFSSAIKVDDAPEPGLVASQIEPVAEVCEGEPVFFTKKQMDVARPSGSSL